ncbi:hypothetical protein NE865_00546 [Phthorimaea operculella]|nr:hypothetical protein NE865_00546 [Phthorimaea operculella]
MSYSYIRFEIPRLYLPQEVKRVTGKYQCCKMEFQVFCVLFAISFTLSIDAGKQSIRRRKIKLNSTIAAHNRRMSLINQYNPILNKPNELDSIYNDKSCKNCYMCMERSIEATIATLIYEPKHNSIEPNNEIVIGDGENRIIEKRSIKNKEHKGKKTKQGKNAVIIKYSRDGKSNCLSNKNAITACPHTSGTAPAPWNVTVHAVARHDVVSCHGTAPCRTTTPCRDNPRRDTILSHQRDWVFKKEK